MIRPSTLPSPPTAAVPAHAVETEPMRLFDFAARDQVAAWEPVHDGVMGGVSRGNVTTIDGAALFQGHLSLENHGGFASFRLGARLPDLSGHLGLRLRVRGDGQVYKLGLRTGDSRDGVNWQASFVAHPDDWTTVELAFDDLRPTWRGRLVTDAPAFDPADIRQLNILIADRQAGPFALELATIDACRQAGSTAAD